MLSVPGPVKKIETGKVEITSQNHGFAVDPASLPDDVLVTHVNLYDGTVEGLELPGKRFALGVLWHPEEGEDFALFQALVEEAAACSRTNASRMRWRIPIMPSSM